MHFNDRNEIIALTPLWKGERLPDGRPKVDEKYLKALRTLTLEEVWKPIFVKGYESQFEGRLQTLHTDGRKLIGRAVTATYCPYRPDLDAFTKELGKSEGRSGTYNQWVIDNLMEYDVPVIDMYDKIYKGTFLGGNLTTLDLPVNIVKETAPHTGHAPALASPEITYGGFRLDNGAYAVAYWYPTNLMTTTYEGAITLHTAIPGELHLVDPMDGSVYTLPDGMVKPIGVHGVQFCNLPITDSPLAILFRA